MSLPSTETIVILVIALLALLVLIRLLRAIRGWLRGHRSAKLNAKLQAYGGPEERMVAERRREAAKMLATSSTGQIQGYEVLEQIEAVYVDGFRRPEEAMEGLKATAAMKGANALINVRHEHSSTGRHAAAGDAVIVRRLAPEAGGQAASATPPVNEDQEESDSE
jgi:uncharacterized protein YbjQ (UPF0145 family)